MNTSLKHLAFNFAGAAVGLLTIMIRDYGTSARQLPRAPADAEPASRTFATHRLAA